MAMAAPANRRSTQFHTTGAVTRGAACPGNGTDAPAVARGRARVSGDARESGRDSARWRWSWGAGFWCTRRSGRGSRGGRSLRGRAAAVPCEATTEAKLAPKLEKIIERLRAGAPDMHRPGADLIAHFLDPDRLLVQRAVVA